jgi:hypothetical protein
MFASMQFCQIYTVRLSGKRKKRFTPRLRARLRRALVSHEPFFPQKSKNPLKMPTFAEF